MTAASASVRLSAASATGTVGGRGLGLGPLVGRDLVVEALAGAEALEELAGLGSRLGRPVVDAGGRDGLGRGNLRLIHELGLGHGRGLDDRRRQVRDRLDRGSARQCRLPRRRRRSRRPPARPSRDPVRASRSGTRGARRRRSISGSSASAVSADAAGSEASGRSSSRMRSEVGHASARPANAGSWPLPFVPCPLVCSATPFVASAFSAAMPPSAARSGNGAGRISCPRFGAQVRQRPSTSFQQLLQVYCRQVMQKLNVLWKASSCWEVTSRSVSLRAAAIASSRDVSSDMTKFFSPRDTTLKPLSRAVLGWADSNV